MIIGGMASFTELLQNYPNDTVAAKAREYITKLGLG